MTSSVQSWKAPRRLALAVAGVLSVVVLAACGSGGSTSAGGATTGSGSSGGGAGLMQAGTLTVGMNLQFKPEMYLDASGKPAGYDVDLLNRLASSLGVKLDIQNLDFNGLIPGLQSKKFDLVSVGLNATPARKEVVDFSRAYVPYSSVLGVRTSDNTPATVANYNQAGKIITALQGSTDEQLAHSSFPNATVQSYSEQNAALLQVATGRANGVVVEDYILAQYSQANPGQLKVAALPQPLQLSYGAWAVQKGDSTLVSKLNSFLCKAQSDGTLSQLYQKNFGVSTFPTMPAGC